MVGFVSAENAFRLSVNTPTSTQLGGVIAQQCPANEWIIGINSSGQIICGVP